MELRNNLVNQALIPIKNLNNKETGSSHLVDHQVGPI